VDPRRRACAVEDDDEGGRREAPKPEARLHCRGEVEIRQPGR